MSEAKEILIIDDSPEDRTYLKRLLGGPQWRVEESDTAEAGVCRLLGKRFDCLLLDYTLPDATGIEVLERLRARSGELDLAVVFLTGVGDEMLAARSIQAGAQDYLPKRGLSRDVLVRAVQNATDKFELTRRERALAERERALALLQSFASSAPVGFALLDNDLRFQMINQHLAELHGLPVEAHLGRTVEETVPAFAQRAKAAYDSIVETGLPIISREFSAQVPGAAADTTYWSESWYPVRGSNSSMLGVGVVAVETTEKRHAEEALRKSNEDLQRFAYVVSHDLQSPLRTVSTMAQLLEIHYEDRADDQAAEFLGFIKSGSQRMSLLISDLLEYSRVARAPRAFELVDASALAESAVSDLRGHIEESASIVTVDRLPQVIADSNLGRVFQNLIGNAVKYRGEKRPEIRVFAQAAGDQWVFAVRDNGIGFEMKDAEKIFDAFQRLNGRQEGSGLGLAICKSIVESYGGRIWAESAPGEGSTFYFALPGANSAKAQTA